MLFFGSKMPVPAFPGSGGAAGTIVEVEEEELDDWLCLCGAGDPVADGDRTGDRLGDFDPMPIRGVFLALMRNVERGFVWSLS